MMHFSVSARQLEFLLRHRLRTRLAEARRTTDELFELVDPDALLQRPIPHRHRLLFYLGHLEAFDFNLLCRDHLGDSSSSPELEERFAFGIDPTGNELPSDQPQDWPTSKRILQWNQELRARVDRLVEEAPFVGWLEEGWALRLAIEHRLMHAETLCYLLHQLPASWKRAGTMPGQIDHTAPRNEWVFVPGGEVTQGLTWNRTPFVGWDNEYEKHVLRVASFRIQRFAVSNLEYLEFVNAGGYQTREFWEPRAWEWRVRECIEHPVFWERTTSGWYWRAMFTKIPLPGSWPVFVSQAEAAAYARFRGKWLPSEDQWQRAAYGGRKGEERKYPWGDAKPEPGLHGGFGGVDFDPAPIDAHPAGRSAFGVEGLIGNGWHWTRTAFAPFPGFEPLPFYPGYSVDFFDQRHFVLKGASLRTDPMLIRPSFRNWFQPHYPYVYATFRCVDSP